MKKQYLSYFFDYLIDIKITRSDGTYRFYESHLSHFGRFLFENNITALENVSKAVLVEYLSLLRSSVQNSTINKRIGIIKSHLKIRKLHPHMFRHTYATKLLQLGVDIKTVMDLMGHNNLSTTQRYQHSSKEHAKKTYLEKYNY